MKTACFDNRGSVTAAANLVAKYLIGFDGNVCGSGAAALGVSLADTDTGYECPLQTGGIAVVLAGGSFSAGGPLVSSAAGKAVAATTFAAAAPVVDVSKLTIGATKLTIDSGATPVTSSAANGDIVTAAADAMAVASGFLAAPVLTGSVLPQVIVGYALDAGSDGAYVRVKLV